MKVLVIEDNKELAQNILNYLSGAGYIVEWAANHQEASDKLQQFLYDCIVLDIMLPDGNGLELLRALKMRKTGSGVLILSAKNALDDKIAGLELGADDYLTKPFHLSELHARLKAIYRRKYLHGDETVLLGDIAINTAKMEVRIGGRWLELTPKEYALLLYLVINKDRVLTRQSIASHLWGDYADNLLNFDFVYQHVKNLRKKLLQAGEKDYIETVYGIGYRLNSSKEGKDP